jgi:hypothetical protein
MTLAIVLAGLTILVCLALLIGLVDGHARRAAWRRIADARREVQEREHALMYGPGWADHSLDDGA